MCDDFRTVRWCFWNEKTTKSRLRFTVQYLSLSFDLSHQVVAPRPSVCIYCLSWSYSRPYCRISLVMDPVAIYGFTLADAFLILLSRRALIWGHRLLMDSRKRVYEKVDQKRKRYWCLSGRMHSRYWWERIEMSKVCPWPLFKMPSR